MSNNHVQNLNKRLVLRQILINKNISRSAIAKNLKLTTATISRITKELVGIGLIKQNNVVNVSSKRGRREIGLMMNPNAGFVIGISINAFAQGVTVADLSANILATKTISMGDMSRANLVLDTVIKFSNEIIKELKIERTKILGCGIAVSGSIDTKNGVVLESTYLWNDKNFPVVSYLQKTLNMPVCLDNVPNSKMLSEVRFSKTEEPEHAILINVALNLGVSFYLNHKIYRGHRYGVSLLNHWLLPTHPMLGTNVSVNDVASGQGVLKADNKYDNKHSDAKHLAQLILSAQKGEAQSINLFKQAGLACRYIVETLDAIIHPQKIIICGPLTRVTEYKESALSSHSFGENSTTSNHAKIVFKNINNQDAAVLMALDEFLVNRGSYNKKSRSVA